MFSIVQNQIEDKTELEIVDDGVPLSPEWMSFEARMEWMRSAPELFKKGQLVGGMIALFENYCVAIGLVREFESMISSDGKIINGKPHPAFKMMLDAMVQAKSIASELKFGKVLNPEEQDNGEDKSRWQKGLLA